jgi:hypothetical protein
MAMQDACQCYMTHLLGGHLSKLVVHELIIQLGWWESELIKKAVRREAKRMWNIGIGKY